MTPCSKIYDAFLSRILQDEWQDWILQDAQKDWFHIMEAALPWFKFPRVSLCHDQNNFEEDLDIQEIQIIANYMKCQWLNRSILTWQNIKPLYQERDFSQANLLDKLRLLLKAQRANALSFESIYYRSHKGKPFPYKKLGDNSGL